MFYPHPLLNAGCHDSCAIPPCKSLPQPNSPSTQNPTPFPLCPIYTLHLRLLPLAILEENPPPPYFSLFIKPLSTPLLPFRRPRQPKRIRIERRDKTNPILLQRRYHIRIARIITGRRASRGAPNRVQFRYMRRSQPALFIRGIENSVVVVPVAFDAVVGVDVTEEYAGANVAKFAVCVGGGTPVRTRFRPFLAGWWVRSCEIFLLGVVEEGKLRLDPIVGSLRCGEIARNEDCAFVRRAPVYGGDF